MFDCMAHERSPYILIVDDDEDDVFLMMSVLRRVGWETGEQIECGSVDNGADALALVSLRRLLADLPVAVILDLNMPKLDGMGALKALRQALGFGELPVFVPDDNGEQGRPFRGDGTGRDENLRQAEQQERADRYRPRRS